MQGTDTATDLPSIKDAPNRPTHAMLKVGKSVIKTKIDWEAYDPKKPDRFTVWGFNKKYDVSRARITFCKKIK